MMRLSARVSIPSLSRWYDGPWKDDWINLISRHANRALANRMDVTQLPFNKLVGLEAAPADSGFLISLPDKQSYTNHLGNVHASALLAVAEAGSGAFLARQFGGYSGFVPVVRRIEAKFRKPGIGRISARCMATSDELSRWSAELATRGRVLASLPVEVVDTQGTVVLSAIVEWFITQPPRP